MGTVRGYVPSVHVKNVNFMNRDIPGTYGVMVGKNKFPMSVIKGEHVPHDSKKLLKKIKNILDDPEWTQIGFNPSYSLDFFDRKTLNPVIDAEEVMGIGGFFLAKNPKYGNWLDSIFTFKKDKQLDIPTAKPILKKLQERFETRKIKDVRGVETAELIIPEGTNFPFNKGGEVREQYVFGGRLASKLRRRS